MAKKKVEKLVSIEETLWNSANKLRGSVNHQNINTLY